jgi:hypothetical protein
MSTVSAAPPVRPVRHGLCRLTLRIGATDYRLRPVPSQPGFRSVWTLRKLDPDRAPATYTVADPKARGEQPGCTCPDHEISGATCKHVMALAALGLVRRPKAARPKTPPKARSLKAHARSARAALAETRAAFAEAQALAPAERCHLAEVAGPIRGTTRRAALAGEPPAEQLGIQLEATAAAAPPRPAPLPEGWVPGGAAAAYAQDLRSAVATAVAVARGELVECAACRYPFDPLSEGSGPLALCGPCLAGEGGES